MNTLSSACVVVVLLVCSFLAGLFGRPYLMPTEPEIRWKTKIQTDVIYRDYGQVSHGQCIQKLQCYDTALPKLEYTKVDAGTYRIGAGLCEREWSRDLTIEVGEGGGWKYAVCAGVAVAGVVGIMYATGAIR